MRTIARLLVGICTIGYVACGVTAPALAQARFLLVDDFDSGEQNKLGGYRNTFERAPSRADAMRISEARLGRYGRAMRMQGDRKAAGFCGTWIHFFNFKAPAPRYLDTTGFKYLVFWVRGHEGGELFTIKLADQRWIEKEDSVAIGRIGDYLPGGVTKQWQEVIVPLKGEHGLTLEKLGGLIFDFDVPGQYTIYVDNIAFKSDRKLRAHPREPAAPTSPRATIASDHFARAMWLWTTDALLEDPNRADELFAFCRQQGIEQVWAQLPYDLQVDKRQGQVVSSKCTIKRQDAVRRLLRSAHKAGIEVHALEGYPEHAQREWHHVSLAIVDAIVEFNRGTPSIDQFDGIHFDNEPHLLVGWHDPARREQILFEFLTLNAECQKRAHAASSKIKFGIDIPFWWQERDVETDEAIGAVTFNGKRQAASYHLIEMLDSVGIMNYRDQAQGADGMIAHGRDLLEHAERAGKARVYMGVETFAYQPTDVMFTVGLPRGRFLQAVRGEGAGLARLSRLDRHRLRVFDDGTNVHVGIEVPQALSPAERLKVANTLAAIAAKFGVNTISLPAAEVAAMTDQFGRALKKDPEWSDLRQRSVRDPKGTAKHALVVATATMLPKITFADDSPEQLTTQLDAAEEFFGRFKSYAGIAVHHYETYRGFLKAKPKARNAQQ